MGGSGAGLMELGGAGGQVGAGSTFVLRLPVKVRRGGRREKRERERGESESARASG